MSLRFYCSLMTFVAAAAVLAVLPTSIAFAQSNATSTKAAAAPQSEKATQSVHDIRKETLLYGIDSQILDLLKTMTEEKDNSLDGEVVQVLQQTLSSDVQKAAIDLLDAVGDWQGVKTATKIVDDRIQSGGTGDDAVVISALRYLTDAKAGGILPQVGKLIQDQSQSVAFEAIASIGRLGGKKQAGELLRDLGDPSVPAALKPEVVLALGQLGSKEAVPELTKILNNPDEDATMRRYACTALGRIGDPASLPAIKRAVSDTDTYLRAAAVSAITGFKGSEVDALLVQALKDSFWRVRVNAAEGLGKRKTASAVPILEYKARYDPEVVVQKAALTSLGEIADPPSFTFLRSVFSNSLINPALRSVAVEQLVANDLSGSLGTIDKFIQSEWDKPGSHLLDYVCKQLSQAKSPKLKPIFERFLGSPSLNIQIYGLRGIGDNGFKVLLDRVKTFDNPKNNESVRAAAESAIEKLK